MGLLDRIKTRLVRTRSALSDGIAGLFRGGRAMDAALVGELEALLYSADLGGLARELVPFAGREVIGGIFKAGVWVGALAVVGVIVLIVFGISKMKG